VYQVTLQANEHSGQGCSLEGVSRAFNQQNRWRTYQVSVEDGRFTLGAKAIEHGTSCHALQSISVKKVRDGIIKSWLPASKNPWLQVSLNESAAVGVVRIQTDDITHISSRWLFQGNSRLAFKTQPSIAPGVTSDDCDSDSNGHSNQGCSPDYEKSTVMGEWDDRQSTGARVGVSDEPCEGTVCPLQTCGWIFKQHASISHGTYSVTQKPYYWVDCKGATGKYIYVQLPGDTRILDLKLKAHRDKPVADFEGKKPTEDTLVCHGLVGRQADTVEPEYVTTDDPLDPKFYSTCFVRTPVISWIGLGSKPTKISRWKYDNECLSCGDYEKYERDDIPDKVAPNWHASDQCQNCDNPVFRVEV